MEKIIQLERLAEIALRERDAGKKLVLCHGTFDLLHIGHVHHFQRAKNYGDVLVVTITADRFVMKGPDRPVFPDSLRAEMIANIECVDFVSIVDAPSAVPAIKSVQPDFYVKGADYKNADDDITDKIGKEQEEVENLGGQTTFTDEVVFSSSELLNRHFGVLDNDLGEQLSNYREKGGYEYFKKLIDSIVSKKVLFVGETIIDEYVFVDTLGKSAKESIIAAQFVESECFAGGVIAAANHTASFCDNVAVISCVGMNDSYEKTIRERLHEGIKLDLIQLPGVPSTRKQRYLERSYLRKMYEVYYMDDTPLSGAHERDLLDRLGKGLEWADLVVVTDFGHGMITPAAVDLLCKKSKFLAVNVQTNSGNRGYNLISKYKRADYVCIDEPELRLAAQDKHASVPELMCNNLPQIIDCERTVITHGRLGCYVSEDGGNILRIPALTAKVVDSVGAGDAFFSITAPLVAAGVALDDVGLIGNVAGAIKVNIVGHRQSVERTLVLKYLETLLK